MTALKAPCPHGRYEAHDEMGRTRDAGWASCPGGTLLPPDSLEREWRAGYAAAITAFDAPKVSWCEVHLNTGSEAFCVYGRTRAGESSKCQMVRGIIVVSDLDALAAAQPGKVPETELDRNQMGIW